MYGVDSLAIFGRFLDCAIKCVNLNFQSCKKISQPKEKRYYYNVTSKKCNISLSKTKMVFIFLFKIWMSLSLTEV